MDIKLYTGAIISTDNPEVIEQHLKNGGVEIKEVEVTPKKVAKKNQE